MISKMAASLEDKLQGLKKQLSSGASVVLSSDPRFKASATRWSDFAAAQPGAVVHVATEVDVEHAVAWANLNGVRFLAQTGGHGNTISSEIGENDIFINMRALNSVEIDLKAGQAVLGGGVIVSEANDAAMKQKAMLIVGTCNTAGILGAFLGGGIGRQQGKYGLGIDNMISARLVNAEGKLMTVSANEHPDLWYGLRGAGHNFGIVTSLTVKAYPAVNENIHWSKVLIFPPPMIEVATEAIVNLDIKEQMAATVFMTCPPPMFEPVLAVGVYYMGTEEEGQNAFKSLLDLGPALQMGGMTAFNKLNEASDVMGRPGGRKPAYGASVSKLSSGALCEIFKSFQQLIAELPDAIETNVLIEVYGIQAVRRVPDEETAFPHRNLSFHGIALTVCHDPANDSRMAKFGNGFQNSLMKGAGTTENHCYVNFALNSNSAEQMYGSGEKLEKLKTLKRKWDRNGRFSFYRPIC